MTDRNLDQIREKHRAWVQERLRHNANRLPSQAFDYDYSAGSAVIEDGSRVVSSLPSRLSLRLIGERLHRGTIDTALFSDVVIPVQSEIRAASNDDEASRLELVGISSGSTVLHFESAVGADVRAASSKSGVSDVLERSVSRVLDVHDLAESGSGGERLRFDFGRPLIDSFAKLTRGLLEHGVELEMLWRSPTGDRRPSRLSERGLSYAQQLFGRRSEVDEQEVAGYVFSLSLGGELVLKANPAKKQSATFHVDVARDSDVLASLALNDYVRLATIRTTERDELGRIQSVAHVLTQVISHESTFPDT